jgi:hypothetical protein
MGKSWLVTTALAVILGSTAVIAQSQNEQKREETPRAQPSKQQAPQDELGRGNRTQLNRSDETPRNRVGPGGDRQETRQKGVSDPQPNRESRERDSIPNRPATVRSKDSDGSAKTKEDRAQRRDENTRRSDQRNQKSSDEAQEQRQSNDQQQRNSEQKSSSDPTNSRASGTARDGTETRERGRTDTAERQRRDQSAASSQIGERERTTIVNRLSRDRSAVSTNINIDVNVGTRLPSRAKIRPLPRSVVQILPQYRGYRYTVMEDEIIIVEPGTRRIVDVISERTTSRAAVRNTSRLSGRITLSDEHRSILLRSARRMETAPTSGGSGALSNLSCLELQAVPQEVLSANPELKTVRMLSIGEQVVLIDPDQRRIVEVVE